MHENVRVFISTLPPAPRSRPHFSKEPCWKILHASRG
jgi:hypothetical protein